MVVQAAVTGEDMATIAVLQAVEVVLAVEPERAGQWALFFLEALRAMCPEFDLQGVREALDAREVDR